jgi:hypothetical protein
VKNPNDWLGSDYREYPTGKYRMATQAAHITGDLGRENPALCIVHGETADHYVGSFIFGFGFYNVKFPKATTRKLTPEEAARFNGAFIRIGSSAYGPITIDEEETQHEGSEGR